jgi:hypothetical protein
MRQKAALQILSSMGIKSNVGLILAFIMLATLTEIDFLYPA